MVLPSGLNLRPFPDLFQPGWSISSKNIYDNEKPADNAITDSSMDQQE